MGLSERTFVKHEVDLGSNDSKDPDLSVLSLPHSLKGLDFIKEHPGSSCGGTDSGIFDDSIDMILCAIGGNDTYRLLPYLLKMTNYKG